MQIVITLEIYGVKQIVGIPFGYRGFSDKDLAEMPLSRKVIQNIHLFGESLLGVSRGGPSISDIVDSIQLKKHREPLILLTLSHHGVLQHLKYLLETKGSAAICVAEGTGQGFLEKTNASGNAVLGDISVYIQQEKLLLNPRLWTLTVGCGIVA